MHVPTIYGGATRPWLAAVLLVATGCATVRPTLEITPAGDIGANNSQGIVDAVYARGRDKPDVQVFDDSTNPLDRTQYEIIGSVVVEEMTPAAISLRNAFWYHQFESRGLFGYCVWQMPLKIVTLSLWNIVPLAWPCVAGNPTSASDRMAYLLPYAQRVTAEMGGDTALLVGTESSQHADTWGSGFRTGPFMNFGAVTEVSVERNTGIKLLILKHTPSPQPSPAPPPVSSPAPASSPPSATRPPPPTRHYNHPTGRP